MPAAFIVSHLSIARWLRR